MIAFGQKPRLFSFHDLREANRTFQTVLEVLPLEHQHGYGAQHGGIQSASETTLLAGGKHKAAAAALRLGSRVAPPEVSGEEMNAESNYNKEEEEDYNDYHYLSD